jgi:putative membrane protein insertion efficiency factor
MQPLLIGLVKAYRLLLGSWMRPSCRFYPSCSGYAIEALQRHGAIAGSYLAVWRIARCGPWCQGGEDPVPLARPRLFSRFVSSSSPDPSPSPSPEKNS